MTLARDLDRVEQHESGGEKSDHKDWGGRSVAKCLPSTARPCLPSSPLEVKNRP